MIADPNRIDALHGAAESESTLSTDSASVPVQSLPGLRQCPRCRSWLPDDDFRVHRRINGKVHRLSYCRSCRTESERVRVALIRQSRERALMHKSWSDIVRAQDQRRSIANVIGRLWDALGGAERIAEVWADALREAATSRRLRALQAYAQLIIWDAQLKPDDTKRMTTEELQTDFAKTQESLFVDLLRNDPAKATRLGASVGFTIDRLPCDNPAY